MKIALGTVDVNDEQRLAYSYSMGLDHKATQKDMQRWIVDNGYLALDDITHEYCMAMDQLQLPPNGEG
ncbi:MAG: hypothetical protein PVI97_00225 [Candidatus Thiodiazotropha sp.]